MSVLEAMSCGVSVIASPVGRIPEIIESGKKGLLVPPKDSISLAQSIVSLLQDKEYASRLAQEGRKTVVERFSAEEMAHRTAHVYEKLSYSSRCGGR
jgi:glycosyltransferase involved in cell wall biosynthesis